MNPLKTEQQVYSDLGMIIEAFLVANNYNDWSDNVLQWGQPTMQEVPSPAILMNIEDNTKYGWVATNYVWNKSTQSGSATVSWYERIKIALTFFKDSKTLIDGDFNVNAYVSSLDVANSLRAYFLSDLGISSLSNLEYGAMNIGAILNPTLQSDENIYARTPNFNLTLVYLQQTTQTYADFKTYEQQQQEFKTNPQGIRIIGV